MHLARRDVTNACQRVGLFSAEHDMSRLSRFLIGMAAALTLVVSAQPAQATPLLPGTTVVPDSIAFTGGETILASVSRSFTSSVGDYTGTLVAAVIREAANPLGGLTFIYQVFNDSTSKVGLRAETNTAFGGFLTNVHFALNGSLLAGFADGLIAPLQGTRSSNGNVVGFNFGPPESNFVDPGESSRVLVIRTSATLFTDGFSSVIDGGVDTVDTFQPFGRSLPPPAPEPASLLMLGGGLLGFSAMIRRRRKA
jgi:PEP-CTERM motif-containing protein